MNLSPNTPKSFLDLFHHDLDCDIKDTQSKLNLHVLQIENNDFCYPRLVAELSNHMIHFSLSRKTIDELIKQKRWGELYTKAIAKFRDYNINEGEAGELLLYCFLEAHLNAPKILTKLEIKLSTRDYAKGSDGIHLLKLKEGEYHLIFGESKLYPSLTTSITKAFESIHEFINRKKSNIHDEIGLINTQLGQEVCTNEKDYELIKSIILPKPGSDNPIIQNKAFSIFAGFEISMTDAEKKLPNGDFLALVRKKVKEEVEGKLEHIKEKIDHYGLHGYVFYVYTFPFFQIDVTRKEIIKKLTEAV